MFNIYVISIIFSMFFLLIVLYLVRRKQLREQYSLLWILVALLMFVLSLNPGTMETLAGLLNVKYAPAMLFLFGLVFSFSLILHMTMVISRLSGQLVRLTQEFSILRQRYQDILSLDQKGGVERSEGQ